MSTFYEQLMQYPPKQREALVNAAGLSLGYVMKHTYVRGRAPKFHFHNAVWMDVASKGALPFTQHTEGDVDWDYVRRALNRAKRKAQL